MLNIYKIYMKPTTMSRGSDIDKVHHSVQKYPADSNTEITNLANQKK